MANLTTDLVEVGEEVLFKGGYMEVYLPKYYFEKNVSFREGDIIKTIGIFNFRIYDSEADKGKKSEVHLYNFPSMLATRPTDTYNAVIKDLIPGSGEMQYTVLRYFMNDIFIVNTNIQKSSDNTITFVNLLNGGRLPGNLSYDDIIRTEMANLEFNGINLKVSATAMELIISEIYRDKQDLTKPFRFRAAEGANLYDYKPVNIKQIATFNSTFTGITFEDIDYNITASVNKARQGKTEAESPIERTIKY